MFEAFIPQTDPGAAYRAQKRAINEAIARALEGGRYVLSQEVSAFEEEFGAFVGRAHTIGVGSGTEALVLALRALDIRHDHFVVNRVPHRGGNGRRDRNSWREAPSRRYRSGDIYARFRGTWSCSRKAARTHRCGHPGTPLRPDGRSRLNYQTGAEA